MAIPDDFDIFGKVYGNLAGTGRLKAVECWRMAMKRGDDPAAIIDGLRAWGAYWRTPGANKAMYAQGFLNQQKWATTPPPVHDDTPRRSTVQSRSADAIDRAFARLETNQPALPEADR